jgi:hypothetical protein
VPVQTGVLNAIRKLLGVGLPHLRPGTQPLAKWSAYSKYLLIKNTIESTTVSDKYSLCLPHWFILSEAHAITIVTDELMRRTVLIAPSGTLSSWCGHSVAPMRSRM